MASGCRLPRAAGLPVAHAEEAGVDPTSGDRRVRACGSSRVSEHVALGTGEVRGARRATAREAACRASAARPSMLWRKPPKDGPCCPKRSRGDLEGHEARDELGDVLQDRQGRSP